MSTSLIFPFAQYFLFPCLCLLCFLFLLLLFFFSKRAVLTISLSPIYLIYI
jgi:hypothetical protein